METYYPEKSEHEGIQEGDTFTIPVNIGDGIIVEKQFMYLGDGTYGEVPTQYRPEKQRGNEGGSGDTDNNIYRRREEDGEGDTYSLNNTGSVY